MKVADHQLLRLRVLGYPWFSWILHYTLWISSSSVADSWHFLALRDFFLFSHDIFKVLSLRKLVHGILLRNSKWWFQAPFIYNKGYKPIFPSVHQNIRDDGAKFICNFGTYAYWNMLWWIIYKLLSKSEWPVLSNLWIISRNIFTFTIFNHFCRTGRSVIMNFHWYKIS